jgi:hypothetical protein
MKDKVAQLIDECDRVRWLAYFDLLGTRALIKDDRENRVFDALWAANQEFKNHSHWAPTLQHAWLSDTFLLIAPDDSDESFERLEYMSRLFAGSLLGYQIPLRGAISCDRFFADFQANMFFGRALVEAYEYGEGQDWIGLLLCPSATSRLAGSADFHRVSHYYRLAEVPWKRQPSGAPMQLSACVLGSWVHRNNQNALIEPLESMLSRCTDDHARIKYVRTLAFLTADTLPRS